MIKTRQKEVKTRCEVLQSSARESSVLINDHREAASLETLHSISDLLPSLLHHMLSPKLLSCTAQPLRTVDVLLSVLCPLDAHEAVLVLRLDRLEGKVPYSTQGMTECEMSPM